MSKTHRHRRGVSVDVYVITILACYGRRVKRITIRNPVSCTSGCRPTGSTGANRTKPLPLPGIGQKTEVISGNTINKVFARVGYKKACGTRHTAHGTRHTASTLLREHEWTKDNIEM